MTKVYLKALCLGFMLLVGGCATRAVPIQVTSVPVYVKVPSECPEKAVGSDLISSRPKPLRDQPRPPDASVRSALSQAQLGKYEAEGGWGDKVVAALQRCQLP